MCVPQSLRNCAGDEPRTEVGVGRTGEERVGGIAPKEADQTVEQLLHETSRTKARVKVASTERK